jgi:hypothetical protein
VQEYVLDSAWGWSSTAFVQYTLFPDRSNPIEGEWHQLKAHGMAGQMFDNTYDLAMAVDACIEERYRAKNCKISRFIFN